MDFELMRKQVVEIGREQGIEMPDNWSGVDAVMPLLDKMRQEGAVILIKLDGQRNKPGDNGPYTVLASSGPITEYFPRLDTHELEDGLAFMIVEYAALFWGHS